MTNQETRELQIQPASTPKRGSWYLLTGLVIGLLLGLAYACLINPVVYKDSRPASLSESDKDYYLATIAMVYAETGHLERAISRLVLLEDENPVFTLGAQAQQALADEEPTEAYALALLASVLQSPPAESQSTDTPCPVPTQTLPISTPNP